MIPRRAIAAGLIGLALQVAALVYRLTRDRTDPHVHAVLVPLPPVGGAVTLAADQAPDLRRPCGRCQFVIIEIGTDGDDRPELARWTVERAR